MRKSKYKVGDRVKVREDLVDGKYYYMEDKKVRYVTVPSMCRLIGQIVTIRLIDSDGSYRIEGMLCNWTDEMFEGLATETSNTTTEIKLEGNMDFKIKDYKVDKNKKVIVVFFEDGDIQKAKCCTGDTYDFERGLEVCIMKHICGGEKKYYKTLKVADEQIIAVDKAKAQAEEKAKIKAKQKAKRAAKRKLRAERKKAERITEMKEAYLSALKEYNGDIDKVVEAIESEN